MFTIYQAAKYSSAPHKLGFCGPRKDCSEILQSKNKRQIKKLLKQFKGVKFYCRQIAKANQIKDIFREDVLEAYWLGNDLLKKAQYQNGGYPHHSYHVWCRQPFNPEIKLNDKLKRICQVSAKKIGDDYYSFHWKQKVQKLNKKQLKNLKYYTKINKCLKNPS